MAILAPRMLINIRHEIYHSNSASRPSAINTLTWDAGSGQDIHSNPVA